MTPFTICDATGKIIRSGICLGADLELQAQVGEFVLPKESNHSVHKVVDGQIVEKTSEDKLPAQYKTPVAMTGEETDTELNQQISDHFFGLVNPVEYRKENYASIRAKFYPDFMDTFADAQVKISKTETQTEGQAQLDQYYTACLAVKTRFPKE